MPRFALLFLLLTLTGCYRPPEEHFDDGYMPNIPALETLVVGYSDVMERDKRLFLSDSRAFYDDNYIETVWMKFRTQANMDVLAGRDLIVDVVEGFLDRVNSNPYTRQDVSNFPFTADNLIVEIEFDSFYGVYVDTRYLARIHLHEGCVSYYANDAINRDTVRFHQRIEPYDKALNFSRSKHYRPWIKELVPGDEKYHDATPQSGQHGPTIKERPLLENRLEGGNTLINQNRVHPEARQTVRQRGPF